MLILWGSEVIAASLIFIFSPGTAGVTLRANHIQARSKKGSATLFAVISGLLRWHSNQGKPALAIGIVAQKLHRRLF